MDQEQGQAVGSTNWILAAKEEVGGLKLQAFNCGQREVIENVFMGEVIMGA